MMDNLGFVRIQVENDGTDGMWYLATLRTELDGRLYQWQERIPKNALVCKFDAFFLYGLQQLKLVILKERDERADTESGPRIISP